MFNIGNVVAAFTEEHVQALTRLTKAQLRYWARIGFFEPVYVEQETGYSFSRLYSFKDVVALRTLAMLRVQNNVPLQHLRKVAEKLSHLKTDLWTQVTLYVLNRKVVFEEPGTGKPQEIVSGQYVIGIPLERIVADTRRDAENLRKRPNSQVGQVTKMRAVVRNAAVVAGTRIPVEAIKHFHEDGYSVQDIIKEYPDLTEADVAAALKHGEAVAVA